MELFGFNFQYSISCKSGKLMTVTEYNFIQFPFIVLQFQIHIPVRLLADLLEALYK